MAHVRLGEKEEGSIIKLKENGVLVDFYIAKQNYESGLNGAGRVLVVRMSCCDSWGWWDDYYQNSIHDYSASHVDTWLNSTYKNQLDPDIQAAMGTTKFYYVHPYSTAAVLERSAFLLSVIEIANYTSSQAADGTPLSETVRNLLKIARLDNSAVAQETRTPRTTESNWYTYYIEADGTVSIRRTNSRYARRPAFTLPSSLYVSDDGSVFVNKAPTAPASITIPAQINGGSTITVEWGAASDAEGNLEGYKVERSVDGGSAWTQIYQGSVRSTTNLVPFGTQSVMYRVKAYDTEGLESGWTASAQATVINNTAPTTPGSISVPEAVQGGQPLTVSWGASSDGENNLAGYSLERQVDGGTWAVLYTGNELSFTDSITKGWLTVAYRVRAFDMYNAYSGYAASETREINNNTPPVITCEHPSGTLLGVKNEDFSISYSVDDEEGDEVAVTEAVDGAVWRTFTAELGKDNSFALSGVDFMKVLNGTHTLAITASDDKISAVHRLSFTKAVTSASVTLTEPMEADGAITICALSVSGSIPADADFMMEVTNNGLDGTPAWEDCTAAAKLGGNHLFSNQTAANGFAFNFRVRVSRGESGKGGYITSVQGGFQ